MQGVEDGLEQGALAGQPLYQRAQPRRVEPVEPVEHLVERVGFLRGHQWEG